LEEAAGERVGRGAMGLDDEIAAVQQEKKRREAELLARGAEQEDDLMGAPADKYSGFETSIAVDDDDQGADEREAGGWQRTPLPAAQRSCSNGCGPLESGGAQQGWDQCNGRN
jgi:hypothetical protein